jgi:hypothetical protein
VRRRLTLDSHREGDEGDEAGVGDDGRPQLQLPGAWRRSNTQECAQAAAEVAQLDHCSDSGAEPRSSCTPELACDAWLCLVDMHTSSAKGHSADGA